MHRPGGLKPRLRVIEPGGSYSQDQESLIYTLLLPRYIWKHDGETD